MCGDPGFSFALVGFRAPEMNEDDGDEERQNHGLGLEVGGRRAFPHAVPFCIGDGWEAGLR